MPHIHLAYIGATPALHAITIAWVAWVLSWVIAARFTNRTTKRSIWTLLPFVAVAAIIYFAGN